MKNNLGKNNTKIYYYTTNEVFKNWQNDEIIWATRSTTSNDSSDTVYALKYFDKINEITAKRYNDKLLECKAILKASKNVSMLLYKELLSYCMKNKFEKFKSIIDNDNERKNWFYYGNKYNIFQMKDYHKYGGSFQRRFLKNPSRYQWIYSNLLACLSEDECRRFLGIPENSHKEYYKAIKELPFVFFPFVICFTIEKDNRFFWDAYTSNKGIALEFDKEELEQYFIENSNQERPMQLLDILYEEDNQINDLVTFLDNEEGQLLMDGTERLCINMSRYKHPYWREEKEVRAIFNARYFNDDGDIVKENYNLKYKNGYKTQDYIEIEVPKTLLTKVIIGPHNSEEKIIQAIGKEKFEMIRDKLEYSVGADIIK